jgi:LysM repeat protein
MARHFAGKVLLAVIGMSVVVGLGSALPVASAQPAGQDGNLLTNPGFEQPFEADQRGDGGGFVAHGWRAWWYNDAGDEYDGPEFKQANIEVDPNRVRSGFDAQEYFRAWAKHLAGVYQQVQVPANSQLRFTIYGHAWCSFCDTSKKNNIKCDARNSAYGDGVNPIALKVGIDPTGGTDPFSQNIVWSAARAVYDNYEQFAVEATAQGEQVTVFTYSSPEWPSAVINVYWDDAALVVIGEGGAQPGGDAATPEVSPPSSTSSGGGSGGVYRVATQPPEPDGTQYHVVGAGETVLGIALAYKVTADSILQLNGLADANLITTGQRLLIKQASPGAAASETPEQPTAEPTAEATEPPAGEVAEAETNQICMMLFEDQNRDGLWQNGEPLLPGGMLNIAGVKTDSHATDGVTEPYCFTGLDGGDYIVSVAPPAGYHLTGLEQIPVTLSSGGKVSLSFGATPGDEAGTAPEAEAEVPSESAGAPPPAISPVIYVVGGLGVGLVLAGGAATINALRRKTGGAGDEDGGQGETQDGGTHTQDGDEE